MREEIIGILTKNHSLMTYVIANILNIDYKIKYDCTKVRNELKKMQKDGLVENVKSIYKTQLKWKLITKSNTQTK